MEEVIKKQIKVQLDMAENHLEKIRMILKQK
jgi:hypothetical protein